MSGTPRAKSWLEISGPAVANNITTLRSLLGEGIEFCAVVKANAYGHGLEAMVRLCSKEKVTVFAVDSVDEAEQVHALVPLATIFILGVTFAERMIDVVHANAIQTVYTVEALRDLAQAARSVGRKARINIKLETGLNRQGVEERELGALLDELRVWREWVEVAGVSSHFASSEDVERPGPTMEQLTAFQKAVSALQALGIDPQYKHIACSAAGLLYPASHGNLVRFGIAMYGLWPSPAVRRQVIFGRRRVDLLPVLSWKTRVAQVKSLVPGGKVGYGGLYMANRPLRLAVLPVGYYDGYDRGLSNRGEVIIRGVRCPVLGRICMNMLMADVSQVPGLKVGDTAVLLGRDGMNAVTADDLAEKLETINYEVVTRLNALIPRVVV